MTASDVRARALHLVDIENLRGCPRADVRTVSDVLDRYLALAAWQPGDIVNIAANPALALEFAWSLPVEASVHTASGPDGADLVLLAHAAPEFVERRAGRLVIGSGDHAFIPQAIAARDRGVGVLVVAPSTGVSSGWRAHVSPSSLSTPRRTTSRLDLSTKEIEENTLEVNVRFDHEFLAVESEHAVHCMFELVVPDAADEQRTPLHIALVLDRSGSMTGAKLDVAKRCAKYLARHLAPTDELAVVAYDDHVDLVRSLSSVDTQTEVAIEGIYPGGTTNLSGGWLKGLEELRRAKIKREVRRVLLLTDGLANVGITDRDQLVSIAAGTKTDAATTTIGFGDGFDEDLLAAIADASGGATYFAENPDDAPAIFAEEFEGLTKLVAQNVSIEITPSTDVQVVSILNQYPIVHVPGGAQVQLGDVYGGERRRLVFELHIPRLAALGPSTVAHLVLRYTTVGDAIAAHETTVPIVVNLVSANDPALGELDHDVVDEVVLLQAARAKQEAIRLADEGLFDEARSVLSSAADTVRGAAPGSVRGAELEDEAARLVDHAEALSAPQYRAISRKRMSSESWRRSRGRPT